ncbi:hypothetical protein BaRGS_00027466 [Batillaria attramentaria]|uniref:RING-type domain-containing protein n=1 Tax=Batillaria attramentaria TaxID=370345 RepID=A0ABD0K1M2_9CAEN
MRMRIEEFVRSLIIVDSNAMNRRRPPPNYIDALPTWKHKPDNQDDTSCSSDGEATDSFESATDDTRRDTSETEDTEDLPEKSESQRKTEEGGCLKSAEGISNGEGYIGCSQCVICQYDVERGDKLCGLPCKHAFHATCIRHWLSTGNHVCPICRRDTF